MSKTLSLTIALTVLVTAVIVGALLLTGGDTIEGGEDPEGDFAGLAPSEILDNPDAYVGDEVTVSGEVSVLTERLMSLGEEDLIVYLEDRSGTGLQGRGFFVGDVVMATGTVRVLDADAIQEDLEGRIIPEQFSEFDDEPVLVADDVSNVRVQATD